MKNLRKLEHGKRKGKKLMIESKRARSERLMKRQHIGDIKEEKKEKKQMHVEIKI